MKHIDLRKLPAAAAAERRRQVSGLRERGMTYAAIAEQVGLTQSGVFDSGKRFAGRGAAGLVSGQRGGKPDEQCLLEATQDAEVQRLIRRHLPAALGLPCALWGGAAGRALVKPCCAVKVAVRTVGKYLARWGFTAQKPPPRADEQRPVAGRRWRRQDYPAILARARRRHGVIFGGDETGLRSEDVRGRGLAPRGRTPVVRVCHKRAGVGLIAAVTNTGEWRRMALEGAVNAPRRIRFLERLVRDAHRKVFLILDRLQVHRSGPVRQWLAARCAEIAVFYLPPSSPEWNPDEALNADLTQAVTRTAPARRHAQLKRAPSATWAAWRSRPLASAATSGTNPSAMPLHSRQ